MTITREEIALIDARTELPRNERDFVTDALLRLDNLMRLCDLEPSKDDRAARLEAALIRYVIESRE